MNFCIIIPARFNATRLPGKLLKDISGKPLIQHTFANASQSNAERVIIATDDTRIAFAGEKFGAEVCMTAEHHSSGTLRIAEALTLLNIDDDKIIVNLQADEPMLSGAIINQLVDNLTNSKMRVATLCEPIRDKAEYLDHNCVKVVFDENGKALYFSRAPIPFFRQDDFNPAICFRHIGIYAYTAGFIKQYANTKPCANEQAEKLEQLRILHAGFAIHIAKACATVGYGVDTEADLTRVRAALK